VYAQRLGTTVDSEEALAELGLEAPTSKEAIRRAYLRSVRRHSPERDPGGFKRVRDAYDLLRDAPWLWGETLEAGSPSATPLPGPLARSSPIADRTEAMPEMAPQAGAAEEELPGALLAVRNDEPTSLVPWRDIEEILRLLEDGKLAEARRLNQSLDRHITELGIGPREIGAHGIARWTLVEELLALEGVASEQLIQELAAGVRSGDFEEADRLRQKGGWRLRRAFAAKAPRLNQALVAPAGVPRFRQGFTRWSWIWVGWVALHVCRACFGSFFATEQPPRPAQVTATANGANGPRTAKGPAQESLVAAARAIDEAVQYSDCNTVREHWPSYERGVREAGFAWSRDNYAGRRKRALDVCAELTDELVEVP